MATSGSFNYSVTALELIYAALENIGAKELGETPEQAIIDQAQRTLNLLIKQWMGQPDKRPGLKVFMRKRIFIFLEKNENEYNLGLGSSGDHATESYVRTSISADEAAGQTILSVTSSTGFTAADNVGIVLDDGSLHWTTVASTGAGTITVNAALPSAAVAGNYVFGYTTRIPYVPQNFVTLMRRDQDQDTNEIPMTMFETIEEYESITYKTETLEVMRALYEKRNPQGVGVLTLDGNPDDVRDVLRAVVDIPSDDIDSTSNDLSYPAQYLAALEWGLAKRLAPKFGKTWTEAHESNYTEALVIAQDLDPKVTTTGYEPHRDGHA